MSERLVHFSADGINLHGPIEEVSEDIIALYINEKSRNKVSEMENIVDNGYKGDEANLLKDVRETNGWIFMASFDLPDEALFHYEVRKLGGELFVIRQRGQA